MRFLLCGINAKYIHSNLAIFSLKAYADRKKIPGAEIISKEYTINNYVEDILQDLYEEKADVVIFSCYIWNISFCLLYTSPSPRDSTSSRMPSSA